MEQAIRDTLSAELLRLNSALGLSACDINASISISLESRRIKVVLNGRKELLNLPEKEAATVVSWLRAACIIIHVREEIANGTFAGRT